MGKTDRAWDCELICCQLKYILILKKKENKITAFLNLSRAQFHCFTPDSSLCHEKCKTMGMSCNQYKAASAHISSSCFSSAPAWAHLLFFQEYPFAQCGSSVGCTMEVCSKLEHLLLLGFWCSLCSFTFFVPLSSACLTFSLRQWFMGWFSPVLWLARWGDPWTHKIGCFPKEREKGTKKSGKG